MIPSGQNDIHKIPVLFAFILLPRCNFSFTFHYRLPALDLCFCAVVGVWWGWMYVNYYLSTNERYYVVTWQETGQESCRGQGNRNQLFTSASAMNVVQRVGGRTDYCMHPFSERTGCCAPWEINRKVGVGYRYFNKCRANYKIEGIYNNNNLPLGNWIGEEKKPIYCWTIKYSQFRTILKVREGCIWDHVEVENGLCICTALPHCFLEWLCECALLCLLKRGFRPWIVTTSLVDCLVSHKRTVASIGSWHSYQFKRPSSPCIRFLYMTTIKDRRRRDSIIPPSSFFSSSAWCTYVLPRLLILRNQLSTTPLIFQDYVRHFISNHWTRLISLSCH